jgi:hypothetical protein
VIENEGFECVLQKNFTNTGTIYVMDDLDVLAGLNYNFQSSYATFKVYGHGVDASKVTHHKDMQSFYMTYNKDLKETVIDIIDSLKNNIA